MQALMIETHHHYIRNFAGLSHRHCRDIINDALDYARVSPDAIAVYRHNVDGAIARVAGMEGISRADAVSWLLGIGARPDAIALAC